MLRCAFDLKKLCIQLPEYYEECFRCFAEYSVANKLTQEALCQEIHNTVIWNNKFIYCFPFRVTVDSRSREFQFKVLHRYLATNKFLHKIGLAPSFLCIFCKRGSESIEHLLIE